MPLEIDIEHVARLARLELTDQEKERLREQLGVILENAAKVGEVPKSMLQPSVVLDVSATRSAPTPTSDARLVRTVSRSSSVRSK